MSGDYANAWLKAGEQVRLLEARCAQLEAERNEYAERLQWLRDLREREGSWGRPYERAMASSDPRGGEPYECEEERDQLAERCARLQQAIAWALGEGDSDFYSEHARKERGLPIYWWRTKLRALAGVDTPQKCESCARLQQALAEIRDGYDGDEFADSADTVDDHREIARQALSGFPESPGHPMRVRLQRALAEAVLSIEEYAEASGTLIADTSKLRALAGPDTPAPKARRESTYTVSWERRDYPEYGHLSCSGLTGRVAFARLIRAVKNSGPVVIHKIEREEGE